MGTKPVDSLEAAKLAAIIIRPDAGHMTIFGAARQNARNAALGLSRQSAGNVVHTAGFTASLFRCCPARSRPLSDGRPNAAARPPCFATCLEFATLEIANLWNGSNVDYVAVFA
jgi:hypothetical protein